MNKIVVGIDGSKNSDRALAWALAEARAHDATLVVAHVWSPAVLYDGGYTPLPATADLSEEASAKQVLNDSIARVVGPDPGVIVEKMVCEGAVGGTLVQIAKDSDLLVVGATGHGAIGRLFVGSVSRYCAQLAPCPVVVVPATERR